jgi:hypothetical protein
MKKHASLRTVALLLSLTLLSGALAACTSETPPTSTTAPSTDTTSPFVSTVLSS